VTASTVRLADLVATVRGAGDVVVLLHGNGEDRHLFDPVAAVLARRRRVVALDTRAHGESPRGNGPLTIDRCADDLLAALDALRASDPSAGRVDLVGFSDGGNIALTFAVAHPDRVRSVVVYGANLHPGGLTARTLWGLRLALAGLRLGGLASPRLRRRAEVWALMTTQPDIDPAALAAVTCPVLVAAGERDVVREDHTRLIAASLPQGCARFVPGATHVLPGEDPARFAALVEEFVDESSRPG